MDEATINWLEHIIKLMFVVGVSAGIGGAVAYWVFTTLGREWFDANFRARLGKYRHAQEKELERLRLKISNVHDRIIELRERELEVIPQAWSLLTDAVQKTMHLTGPQAYCPDLNTMTIPQLEQFLARCSLAAWEKDELKLQADKKQYYIDHIHSSRLVEARKHAADAHFYIVRNGIFLPLDLSDKFLKLSGMVWEALMEHQQQEEHKDVPGTMTRRNLLHEKGADFLKELEGSVHHSLWDTQKARSATQRTMPEKGFTLFMKRLEEKIGKVWPASRTEGPHP